MLLKSVAVRNFKSLKSSGVVRLKPLTVLVGNNGSGKSSLIEAVETYRDIVLGGLDLALEPWSGLEQIRHKSVTRSLTRAAQVDPSRQYQPVRFKLDFRFDFGATQLEMEINARDGSDRQYIQDEHVRQKGHIFGRGRGRAGSEGRSILLQQNSLAPIVDSLRELLFLRLDPLSIGALQPTRRSGGRVRLAGNGHNIAEYLIDLRTRSPSTYEEIVAAMRYILPYAKEVQPSILETGVLRRGYLQLLERDYEIPGWLMSSGSLRALPLVATLLDPDPAPIVFVEEIENGLDPRSIGLIVELLTAATSSGRIQVIATTHSPYLMDQLDLADVLLCERKEKGPTFTWPADCNELENWRQRFTPGRLYTMNVLQAPVESKAAVGDSAAEIPEGGWGTGE